MTQLRTKINIADTNVYQNTGQTLTLPGILTLPSFSGHSGSVLGLNNSGIVTIITGGTGSIVNKTHSQLLSMKTGSTLTLGQLYRITDCITKYKIPNTSVITSGTTEPLIVLATSSNTLDKQAYSTLFPSDIIIYDITDTSCEDGTWNAVQQKYLGGTLRTGKITYRKDTIRGLEIHYDWRNVQFRRWKVDCANWISGGSNAVYDLRKAGGGNIYVCCSATTITDTLDPSLDTSHWLLWLDITLTSFWSWTPTKANFNVGNVTTTNLIINNTIPGTDYNDYYTFTITNELTNSSGIITNNAYGTAGNGYRQFSLGDIDKDFIGFDMSGIDGLYNNMVFLLTPDGTAEYYCESNKLKNNCFNYTVIATGYYNNSNGNNSNGNIIAGRCHDNAVNIFSNNIIGGDFMKNVLSNTFSSNIVGSSSQHNQTMGNVIGCIMKSGFQYNAMPTSISNINFVSATHVYGSYNCEIFARHDGSLWLKFVDDTNSINIVVI